MLNDWENEEPIVPVLHIRTEQQIKQLEERKLVEESDNALIRNLFQEDPKKILVNKKKNNN
jgi:hypothetical protein